MPVGRVEPGNTKHSRRLQMRVHIQSSLMIWNGDRGCLVCQVQGFLYRGRALCTDRRRREPETAVVEHVEQPHRVALTICSSHVVRV